MVLISPKLTFYAFLPLPVVSIVIQYFGRRIHERFERIQAMFSDISARAQENFSGARVIRAYVQEEAEIASFESANQEYVSRSLKLVRLMGMLWPTLELMLGLAMVLVLWIGGREVLHGQTDGGFSFLLENENHSVASRLHDGGRFRRLQHLHDAVDVSCDRAGLGGQHFPARHGVADSPE